MLILRITAEMKNKGLEVNIEQSLLKKSNIEGSKHFNSEGLKFHSNSLAYDSNVMNSNLTEGMGTTSQRNDSLTTTQTQNNFNQQEFRKFLRELQIENDMISASLSYHGTKNPSYIRALYYKKLCN